VTEDHLSFDGNCGIRPDLTERSIAGDPNGVTALPFLYFAVTCTFADPFFAGTPENRVGSAHLRRNCPTQAEPRKCFGPTCNPPGSSRIRGHAQCVCP
jgi:hypothetical protein